MEALEERRVNANMLEGNSLIYLHCCTVFHSFEAQIQNLPFLSLNLCYCHFSFINSLAQRRMCVIPHSEKLLKKLEAMKSPCVAEVLASTVFEMNPEEVDDVDRKILLIWDFKVCEGLSASASAVRPCLTAVEELPSAPLLDFRKTLRNCATFPQLKNVLIEGNVLKNETNSESIARDEEENEVDDNNQDLTEEENDKEDKQKDVTSDHSNDNNDEGSTSRKDTHTEIYQLKGSSFHAHFQTYLRICKFKILAGTTPSIHCHLEPQNKRDENAVVVQALLNSEWRPLGYIPAKKVEKVNIALSRREIVDMKLKNVVYQYIHELGQFKYFPVIQILKIDKWLPDNKDYVYNDPISY